MIVTTSCTDGCRNQGTCLSGVCQCDAGYTLSAGTCLPVAAPAVFAAAFDDDPVWPWIEGGQVAGGTSCTTVDSGSSLVFGGASEQRLALTPQLDARNMTYVSYAMNTDASCYGPSISPTENIVLLYSVDGARTFARMDSMARRVGTVRQSLPLPRAAQTLGLQLLFWQPVYTARSDVWALDSLYVGNGAPSGANLHAINLDFYNASHSQPIDAATVTVSGGAVGSMCNRDALVFRGEFGAQALQTFATDLPADSILQLELSTGCSAQSSARADINILYSDNDGASWSPVFLPCSRFTSSRCSTYRNAAALPWPADALTGGFHRIVLPLETVQAGRRYRVELSRGGAGVSEWAVASLYMGNSCPGYCGGHGACRSNAVCDCDAGFAARDGTCVPDGSQLRALRTMFEDDLDPRQWPEVRGGRLAGNGGGCNSRADGSVLRFGGSSADRRLVSADLDLRRATFVQYEIQLGMSSFSSACYSPTLVDEGVLVLYSTDGAVTWTVLRVVPASSYRTATILLDVLPAVARTAATRLAWWQPHADGADRDVWVLDNVVIAYDEDSLATHLHANLSDVAPQQWLYTPQFEIGACDGRPATLLATSRGAEAVTRDLQLERAERVPLEWIADAAAAGRANSSWSAPVGARVATACGVTAGWVFDQNVAGNAARSIETRNMDTSADNLELSFFLALGGGGCDAPDTGSARDEDVCVGVRRFHEGVKSRERFRNKESKKNYD